MTREEAEKVTSQTEPLRLFIRQSDANELYERIVMAERCLRDDEGKFILVRGKSSKPVGQVVVEILQERHPDCIIGLINDVPPMAPI